MKKKKRISRTLAEKMVIRLTKENIRYLNIEANLNTESLAILSNNKLKEILEVFFLNFNIFIK